MSVECLQVAFKEMKPIPSFEILLNQHGYSKKLVKEIWKWYDSSEMKGVASF